MTAAIKRHIGGAAGGGAFQVLVIQNGFDRGLCARGEGREWRPVDGETPSQFQARVIAAALASGLRSVAISGLPARKSEARK